MLQQNKNTIKIVERKKKLIEVHGKKSLKPIKIDVPNDPSSVLFYSPHITKKNLQLE